MLGAPEGTASDVYAVGVMMFELLTDELPYESYDRASVADRVARRTPPPSVRERNRLVPEGLSDAVSACLALEPDERPRDMAALRERLDDWAEQPSVTPAPLPRPRKTARTSVASVAASLAILGAIGVAVGRTPARVANSAAATVARQVPAALERRPQPPIRAEEPDEDAVEADEDERRERERQQREL